MRMAFGWAALAVLLLAAVSAGAETQKPAKSPAKSKVGTRDDTKTGAFAYPHHLKPRAIPPAPVIGPGRKLKPGDMFRDCATCPEMVVLPAGVFVMGSKRYKRERPPRAIRIRKPFAMGRFEVQHAEWQACVDAGGCSHRPHDHKWGTERRPVINIDHGQAEGFAKWLSRTTGRTYRLPSEAEWEYAARAGSTKNYAHGDEVGQGMVNCRKCGTPWSGLGNAPVGSFPPNKWGLYDMHGNAFEWVKDCWHGDYIGAPKDASARLTGNCALRVIRGGSWYYYSRMSRAANRQKNPAAVKSYWLSFRLVRELP